MKCSATTPEQWFEQNAGRLIDCRWRCRITPEACRVYQSRAVRSVTEFGGVDDSGEGVDYELVRCLHPEPCPHFLPADDPKKVHEAPHGSARLSLPQPNITEAPGLMGTDHGLWSGTSSLVGQCGRPESPTRTSKAEGIAYSASPDKDFRPSASQHDQKSRKTGSCGKSFAWRSIVKSNMRRERLTCPDRMLDDQG